MRRCLVASLPVIVLALQGCGGGGAAGGSSTTQTFNGYGITATFQGRAGVSPAIVGGGGGGAAFTGLYGVSFTMVQATQTPTLVNTKIAFSRRGQLWAMNGDTTNEAAVTLGFVPFGNSCMPAFHPNGRVVAISRYDTGITNAFQIFFASIDGTSLTRMTSRANGCFEPAWNPSGSLCAFSSHDNASNKDQIYTIPAAGGTPTKLSDGTANDSYPTFSKDGTKIYFLRAVSTNFDIYTMSVNGGTATANVVAFPFTFPDKLSFSPDGTTLVTSDGTNIYIFSPVSGQGQAITTPVSGTFDHSPTFSPDGRSILYEEDSTNGSQLFTMNFNGGNQTAITAIGDYESPTWGPYPQNRNIIGSGSYLATGASGFVMGEIGNRLISFVAFTATTASSANIVAETQTPDNTVFQLKGDAITNLAFFNDIFGTATVIVPVSGMTTIGGALVSFNSGNGKVVLVAPYSPGVAKMAPMKNGTTLTYSGQFVGIWNGSGKNLAPKGASTVRIDSKTGALVSFN